MAKDSYKIILTPARHLYAPLATTLPADSLAAGGAWPSGWVDLYDTQEATKITWTIEKFVRYVEQSLAPRRTWIIKREGKVETVLSEFSMTNLSIAWDGSVAITTAAPGVTGKEVWTPPTGVFLTDRMWGIEGSYVSSAGNTHPIRVILYKVNVEAGGDLTVGKSENVGIPLKIQGMDDDSGNHMTITKITAPAT